MLEPAGLGCLGGLDYFLKRARLLRLTHSGVNLRRRELRSGNTTPQLYSSVPLASAHLSPRASVSSRASLSQNSRSLGLRSSSPRVSPSIRGLDYFQRHQSHWFCRSREPAGPSMMMEPARQSIPCPLELILSWKSEAVNGCHSSTASSPCHTESDSSAMRTG